MAKTVEGYITDIPDGTGIAGVPVVLRYQGGTYADAAVTGIPGQTSSSMTTTSDGHFKWTADLSPGPVYVDATVGGVEVKRRYGAEVMQSGSRWDSDLGVIGTSLGNGVVSGRLSSMLVTPSVVNLNVTVGTGHAVVEGYFWDIESGPITLTLDTNTGVGSLLIRKDYIVLRQHVGGSMIGRQEVAIVKGTVSDVAPALTQNATIYEYPLALLKINQNAITATVDTDFRTFQRLNIYDGTTLVESNVGKIAFESGPFVVTKPKTGEVNVAPSFGSGALDFAAGSHTHTAILNDITFAGKIFALHPSSATKFGFAAGGGSFLSNAGYTTTMASAIVALDASKIYDVILIGMITGKPVNNPSLVTVYPNIVGIGPSDSRLWTTCDTGVNSQRWQAYTYEGLTGYASVTVSCYGLAETNQSFNVDRSMILGIFIPRG